MENSKHNIVNNILAVSMINYQYLIDVYKANLSDSNFYLKTRSTHWDEWFGENKKFLKLENLINFRNNRVLSAGLDDSINLLSKLELYELLDNFDSQFLKKNLPNKNVGNCNNVIKIFDYYFDFGILHHLKWYEKIEKYISDNSNILEIGGGFGSLARIIIKNKKVKYFLIDLPEANLQSNFYLQENFPDLKIFNYLDLKNKNIENEIKNFDIFILPPDAIDLLEKKNIFFDFIINSRSFMEMEKKIISKYFIYIQNKINIHGHFLNINRYVKSVVGDSIYFKEYPYDNFWNVTISEKSFLQNHVHFLLTQRTEDKNASIENTLKNLPQVKINKKSFKFINKIKNKIFKIIYKTISKILLLFLGKNKIRKISNIFFNISNK